jgi:hypothetical protein
VRPQRWQRRPVEVEAMLLADDNADEVAAWASGRVADEGGRTVVRLPSSIVPVQVGDYAVRDVVPDGLGPARPMLAGPFEHFYEPCAGPRRHRRRD